MSQHGTKKQRVLDLKGLAASNGLTLKEIVEASGIPYYNSVITAMNFTVRGVSSISSERLDKLESAAIKLVEKREVEKVT